MRIGERLQGISARIRTAVHLYRARRRTRQVFGRRPPQTSVIVVALLAVMISATVYFFSANPAPPEEPLEVISESDAADLAPSAAPAPAQPETNPSETAPASQAKEEPSEKMYPIDTDIPDEITSSTLFGDERFDATLLGVCSAPIKDAKRDVENVYAYNLEAQEEFDAIEQEYLRQKEKIGEARTKFVEKRQKLDAIRIGCIEEKNPFGEAFEAYLDRVQE